MSWTRFWEQFRISVHERTSLADSEKFVYLQQALRNGSARSSIDGLSQSGDNYSEAIACLKARFDRPRLIHKGHVKMILEAPSLKEGNGKELRDAVQQHMRALKSMGYEPSGPFITSALELKLDDTTMFEWQKHSQSSSSVPHFQDLLDFLNLRAQATESNLPDRSAKRPRPETHHDRKKTWSVRTQEASTQERVWCAKPKSIPFMPAPSSGQCLMRRSYQPWKHNLCSNSLCSGHFWRKCTSLHKCKVCQKPHHTLLHVDQRSIPAAPAAVTTPARSANAQDGTRVDPPNVSPNTSNNNNSLNGILSATAVGMKHNSLLMTCLVRVKSPDGASAVARALLDSASSATFISERLAQGLRLPRTKRDVVISGIAGLTHKSQTPSPLSRSSLSISPLKYSLSQPQSSPKSRVSFLLVLYISKLNGVTWKGFSWQIQTSAALVPLTYCSASMFL